MPHYPRLAEAHPGLLVGAGTSVSSTTVSVSPTPSSPLQLLGPARKRKARVEGMERDCSMWRVSHLLRWRPGATICSEPGLGPLPHFPPPSSSLLETPSLSAEATALILLLLGDGNCGEQRVGNWAGSGGAVVVGAGACRLVEHTDTYTQLRRHVGTRTHPHSRHPYRALMAPTEIHPHSSQQTKTITLRYTNTHTPAPIQADTKLTATGRSDSHRQRYRCLPTPPSLGHVPALGGRKVPHQAEMPKGPPREGKQDTHGQLLPALSTPSCPPGNNPGSILCGHLVSLVPSSLSSSFVTWSLWKGAGLQASSWKPLHRWPGSIGKPSSSSICKGSTAPGSPAPLQTTMVPAALRAF
nr:uncharacterized protein LOC129058437 isoform X1 [Pongo abelii]